MKERKPIGRGIKITALVLAVIIVAWGVIALLPIKNKYWIVNPMRKEGDLPILIAHGGGNKEFPDNTLEAFYNAYSVDERVMMETDVNITKDGVVILSHDTTLDRKTTVTGAIADWNYSDLIAQEVDFGYTNPTTDGKLSGEREHFKGPDGQEKYPTDVEYPEGVAPRHETVFLATTLEELLVAFPNNYINVEIKQSGEVGMRALKEVLRLLKEHNAYGRVVVASFHEELYKEFQRLLKNDEVAPTFMYSPAYGDSIKFFVLQALGLDVFFKEELCVFQLPMKEYGIKLATKGFVKSVHEHNYAVHFWTVNDKEDMEHLIDIGADGITTDYPHRLKEVYDSYGK